MEKHNEILFNARHERLVLFGSLFTFLFGSVLTFLAFAGETAIKYTAFDNLVQPPEGPSSHINPESGTITGVNSIFSTFKKEIRKPVVIVEKIKNAGGEVYAILSYEPTNNYLLMKWIGYSSEDEVKVASLKMLEWQRKEGCNKNCKFHVHDTKEIEGAWIGLIEWIDNELFPLSYQAGLRYNLSIMSPDIFSKMSSVALQQKKSRQVPTVLFETLSQAETWLMEKNKTL